MDHPSVVVLTNKISLKQINYLICIYGRISSLLVSSIFSYLSTYSMFIIGFIGIK